MALALYRKYRPATFGEVVGQEHVTEPLRTALSSGRINHAYLFSGPRGCGKTSSARILARSLNCDQGPTADPCGTCESCVALGPEGAGSVDVVELDAASHGGVDDTRELRDRAFFAPARSRYRIFVIDEAHMVTTQGFNALLKIVEEPPEHLIFVFATTEPDKVLTTIRSRTHHYPFRLMPPGVLRALLQRICDEEGVLVEPAVYPLVIRAGGGSARDTLSILDQLLAGAGAEGVTYERAVALLGVTDVALIDDVVDALAAADSAAVYGTVDRLVEAGHDPRRFGSDLLDRLRDLVLLHSVPDAAERGLIDVHGDELTRMQHQAENLGAATLSRFAEIVHTGLGEMRGATAPRLLLELMCARMLLPTASDSEAALLQRLERVERRMTIAPAADSAEPAPETSAQDGGQRRVFQRPSERAAQPEQPAAPAAEPATAAESASARESAPAAEPETAAESAPTAEPDAAAEPVPVAAQRPDPSAPEPAAAAPEPPAEPAQPAQPEPARSESPEPAQAGPAQAGYDAAEIRRIWTGVLQAVAERNRPTQALLLNATVQELRGSTLVLSMPTSGLVKQLAQQRRLDFIRDALGEVLGGEWDIHCVEAGAAPPAAAQQQKPTQQQPSPDTREKPAAQHKPAQPQRSAGPASAAGPGQPSGGPRATVPKPPEPDDVPPPPEPPPEDEPPPDDVPPPPDDPPPPSDEQDPEAMFAESSSVDAPQVRRDQDQVAVDLLTRELGARRVDS